MKDPYEAIGSHLRVHHPVQPKTQVEKWGEEMRNNSKEIEGCCGYSTVRLVLSGIEKDTCPKTGTDKCFKRDEKNTELAHKIIADHEKNKRHLHKFFGGEFEDDIKDYTLSDESIKNK